MTDPVEDQVPDPLGIQAVDLYLAGMSHVEIAAELHVTFDQAVTLVEEELERRNPGTPINLTVELERVTSLWRGAYTKAINGDLVAQRMTLALSQYRIRLLGQADRARRSSEVKPGGPTDIQTAWTILAGGAPSAATALLDVANNGRSELARVTAATAILDRVGLVGKPDVQIAVIPQEVLAANRAEQTESLADVVRARLKALAPVAIENTEVNDGDGFDGFSYVATNESAIIDAEVVVIDAS
jgi:hypothetical protein